MVPKVLSATPPLPRSNTDLLQLSRVTAIAAPGLASNAAGDVRMSAPSETADPVGPARPSQPLQKPRAEENRVQAAASREFIEPDRAPAAIFATDAPTEATPAGPPPTFAWSILEKARAVAGELVPAGAQGAEKAEKPATATVSEQPPSGEDRDILRADASSRTDPTTQGALPKPDVPGETA